MLTIIMAFAVTILTIVVTLIVCTAQDKLPIPYRKYIVQPGNGSYVIPTSAPDIRSPNSGKGKKDKEMPPFLKSLVNLGNDPADGDEAPADAGKPSEDTQEQPPIPHLPLEVNGTHPFQGWKLKNGTLLDLRRNLFHK
jgi:hypothetical protein